MKKFVLLFLVSFFPFLNADDAKIQELKQNILAALPGIEGWCSKEKALTLVDLVLEVQPAICVEIGILGGSSLFPVTSTLKFLGGGIAIGIDPWSANESLRHLDPVKDKININWWGNLNFNRVYNDYLKMLKNYELENYCITLKMTSEEAVFNIPLIDLLHIDGNFSETGSLQDVMLYLPKVRPGGYILISGSLSTQKRLAVNLLVESCDPIKLIDKGNCILFKKR